MKKLLPKSRSGFTLIELLVVIGILAVLLAITLIAINPARQFAQSNNTKRASDVNAILNAIHQYGADNRGNLTAMALTSTPTVIGSAVGQLTAVCALIVPRYIAQLPVDPLTNNGAASDCTAPYNSNYQVSVAAPDNRITVTATATELGIPPISVTR